MRTMLVALGLAAALAAGCGDDGGGAGPDDGRSTTTSDAPANVATGRTGGKLTVLRLSELDSTDPGITYSSTAVGTHLALHRPLMGFAPGDDTPRPDLAAAEPEVSDGGRTVTVKIREGVRFAPPVDRDVVAPDVKYAIERGFLKSVANPYAQSYFGTLEGVKEFRSGEADEISGLQTPDDRTLRFKLARPAARVVIGAFVLPLSAAVPPEVAREHDAKPQSTYGESAVTTGPYKIAQRRPGRVTVLERNEAWNRETDFRPAYFDRIELRPGNDPRVSVRQAVEGRATIAGAEGPPPPFIGRTLKGPRKAQVVLGQGGDTVTLALDTTRPPFDDVDARRAFAAAFPRAAAIQAFGGAELADPASHFIPPGVAGFEEAGGHKGTGADFLANPAGDPKLAASYLKKAGLSEKERKVVYVDVRPPGGGTNRAAEFVAGVLKGLGFDVTVKLVGVSRVRQLCFQEGHVCQMIWARDFDDAQTILEPLFSKRAAQGQRPSNLSRFVDPEIDRMITDASALSDPAERAQAWAEIDRRLTDVAAAVPAVWPKVITTVSEDIKPAVNPFTGGVDLSHSSLR